MAPSSRPGDSTRGSRVRHVSRQGGFTYLGLLMAIVIMGLLLTVVGRIWSTTEQRERETQLLWVGHAYREAIAAYVLQNGRYPLELQELLGGEDPALPRRYLRRLYPDPMTGAADWSLITAPNGTGIMGIASTSTATPFKIKNFDPADSAFEDTTSFADWQFVYVPRRWRAGLARGAATGVPPSGAPAAAQPGSNFQPGRTAPAGPGGLTTAPGAPVPPVNPTP